MSKVRLALAGLTLVFLTGGFVASQLIRVNGDPTDYIHRLDASPVPMFTLILLICSVVLAFVPVGQEEAQS